MGSFPPGKENNRCSVQKYHRGWAKTHRGFLMLWKKSHRGPTIFSFLTGDNILATFSTGEASGRPPGWIWPGHLDRVFTSKEHALYHRDYSKLRPRNITHRHRTHNRCQQAFNDHGQHMTYSAYCAQNDRPSRSPIQALGVLISSTMHHLWKRNRKKLALVQRSVCWANDCSACAAG